MVPGEPIFSVPKELGEDECNGRETYVRWEWAKASEVCGARNLSMGAAESEGADEENIYVGHYLSHILKWTAVSDSRQT